MIYCGGHRHFDTGEAGGIFCAAGNLSVVYGMGFAESGDCECRD